MEELNDIRSIQHQRFLLSQKRKIVNDVSQQDFVDTSNSLSNKRCRIAEDTRDSRLEWLLGRETTQQQSSSSLVLSSSSSEVLDTTTVGKQCYAKFLRPDSDPETLRILSWNIDGLSEHGGLIPRTKAVVEAILVIQPDAVFLQEVVGQNEKLLSIALEKSYHIVKPHPTRAGQMHPYYCLILVAKDKWSLGRQGTRWFPGSAMGRHLLSVECEERTVKSNRRKIQLLTSHLESLAPSTQERMAQLDECYRQLIELSSKSTVGIFGGDLNARDAETNRVLNSTNGKIIDCWEALGQKLESRYTWDLKLNDNQKMPNGGTPRCRFDRMYYLIPSSGGSQSVKLFSFQLVGEWRLSNGMFPSDHFGILVTFHVSVDGRPKP